MENGALIIDSYDTFSQEDRQTNEGNNVDNNTTTAEEINADVEGVSGIFLCLVTSYIKKDQRKKR